MDPEFGARLTGKLGRWNIGLLGADDRAAGSELDENDPRHGDRASIGVLRVQREFGKQSNIGVLLTDREFDGSYNRVGAADARFKLNKNWTVSGQAMASQTRELDGPYLGGNAYNFDLHRQSRDYTFDWSYIDRSEGFQSQLGFIPRVNIRQAEQYVSRRFHPKSKIFLSYGPQLDLMADADHFGVQQDWRVNPGFNLEMARNSYFSAFYSRRFERYGNINFSRDSKGLSAHTEYFKRATFDFNYSEGTRINYSPPAGVAPFLAMGRSGTPKSRFGPLPG